MLYMFNIEWLCRTGVYCLIVYVVGWCSSIPFGIKQNTDISNHPNASYTDPLVIPVLKVISTLNES